MRGYLIVGEQPRKLQMASNNSAVRDYWNQHIHDLEITRILWARRVSSPISISTISKSCTTCRG